MDQEAALPVNIMRRGQDNNHRRSESENDKGPSHQFSEFERQVLNKLGKLDVIENDLSVGGSSGERTLA